MAKGLNFVAIDFETADPKRDSACAVACVRVERGRVVERVFELIRPPRPVIQFTWVHGITWNHVRSAPTFGQLWPEIEPLLEGADFIAAHNAPFDRSVLKACCEAARLRQPVLPFLCTCRVARSLWGIAPAKLPDVCSVLRIPLRHHSADSDAEACAQIVLATGTEFGLPKLRAHGLM